MPDLSCTVRNCSYNDKELCSLKAIDVSGGGERENTCCSSFTSSSKATDKCGCACSDTSITCDATDCMYNNDCACEAEHVDVCTRGSIAQHSDDTECHSYNKK